MTTNKQYKEMVEKKFGKELREIMYKLCVERDLVPSQGALELGVPKDTFIYWRNHFRFGPKQLIADKYAEMKTKEISKYKEQLGDTNIEREFIYKDQQSIDGLKEIIERFLELEKYKRTKNEQNHFAEASIMLKVVSLETIIEYIDLYMNEELHQKFINELNYVKAIYS